MAGEEIDRKLSSLENNLKDFMTNNLATKAEVANWRFEIYESTDAKLRAAFYDHKNTHHNRLSNAPNKYISKKMWGVISGLITLSGALVYLLLKLTG